MGQPADAKRRSCYRGTACPVECEAYFSGVAPVAGYVLSW